MIFPLKKMNLQSSKLQWNVFHKSSHSIGCQDATITKTCAKGHKKYKNFNSKFWKWKKKLEWNCHFLEGCLSKYFLIGTNFQKRGSLPLNGLISSSVINFAWNNFNFHKQAIFDSWIFKDGQSLLCSLRMLKCGNTIVKVGNTILIS